MTRSLFPEGPGMRHRVLAALLLLGAIPALCQVEPSATGGTPAAEVDQPMDMPPPVSGAPYPSQTTSETKSNFVSFGVGAITAYLDNVLIGLATKPVSDEMYSVFPVFTYNMETPRQSRLFSYNSGYTFYQHTTALNYVDQAASGAFRERLTSHMVLNFSDAFVQSSGWLGQPSSASPVSGSASGQQQLVIAPFANELTNTANAGLSDQFSQNSMLGASFNSIILNFPNPSQVVGINDSQLYGGSGFFNQRLSHDDYAGAIYEIQRMTTSPTPSVNNVQTVWLYFTRYLNRTASLSVAMGPQFAVLTSPGAPAFHLWAPAATLSLGWQAKRTNFALSYMHSEMPTVGFPGLFSNDTGTASVTQRLSRTWIASASGSDGNFSNQDPHLLVGLPGGHNAMASASIQHMMGAKLTTQLGYTHMHESYSSLSTFTQNPNTNEVFVSVSYQFQKSIGR